MFPICFEHDGIILRVGIGRGDEVIEKEHLQKTRYVVLGRIAGRLQKLKDVGAARAARIGVFVFRQASERLTEVFLMQPFHDVVAG